METVNITEARKQLYHLVDASQDSHEPIQITGKRCNAILLSEDDYKAMNETLYLLSVPNMRESIIEGMDTPLNECNSELEW